jgi:hypothetical protein
MADGAPPLVPADIDLRDFQSMMFDVVRFRDSGLVAQATADEIVAAVLLWSASWHQIPASSLPNDDAQLSRLAGYGRGVREFKKVRAGAMRNLLLCSDGRYYHPVVAEKAAEAWNSKIEAEHRRACDRARKDNKDRPASEWAPMPVKPPKLVPTIADGIKRWTYATQTGVPPEGSVDSSGTCGQFRGNEAPAPRKSRLNGSEGNGRERKGMGIPTPSPSARSSPSPGKTVAPAAAQPPPESKSGPVWTAYSSAYRERYGVDPVRNKRVNAQLALVVDRLGVEDAPKVAEHYLTSNRGLYVSAGHAVDLLLRDAEKLRTEWATGRAGTDQEARNADRTAARGNVFEDVRRELKGGADADQGR